MPLNPSVIFTGTLFAVLLGALLGASVTSDIVERNTIIASCQYFYGDIIDSQESCISNLKGSIASERARRNKGSD